jgi:hypothetical protein
MEASYQPNIGDDLLAKYGYEIIVDWLDCPIIPIEIKDK